LHSKKRRTKLAKVLIKKQAFGKAAALILIALAILLLMLWETKGRELVLMDEVYIAASDMAAGTVITENSLEKVSVPGNAVADGAITPGGEADFIGKVLTSPIPRNGQISAYLLTSKEDADEGISQFTIKKEWIGMVSSSLRRGDKVEIMTADGRRTLGTYAAAYVKDSEGNEVSDLLQKNGGLLSSPTKSRADASGIIDHIEIECAITDYLKIEKAAQDSPLLLIRR
jgi:hypothetical protein